MNVNKSKMVKLLRYVNGAWRVVDYGVASKVAVYTAMGFVVQYNTQETKTLPQEKTMSFDDRNCPCGGKKKTGTMLCQECEKAFSDLPEMTTFRDEHISMEHRRAAAIKLLAASRGRTKPTWAKHVQNLCQ